MPSGKVIYPGEDSLKGARANRQVVLNKQGEEFYRQQDRLENEWMEAMIEADKFLPSPKELVIGKTIRVRQPTTKPPKRVIVPASEVKVIKKGKTIRDKYKGILWD